MDMSGKQVSIQTGFDYFNEMLVMVTRDFRNQPERRGDKLQLNPLRTRTRKTHRKAHWRNFLSIHASIPVSIFYSAQINKTHVQSAGFALPSFS
jgi:hypothetical protein